MKLFRNYISKKEVKEEPKGVEREPLAAGGLAGALKVAAQKGYIDKDTKRTVQVYGLSHLKQFSLNCKY